MNVNKNAAQTDICTAPENNQSSHDDTRFDPLRGWFNLAQYAIGRSRKQARRKAGRKGGARHD
jgi:hypothetical protein